MLNQTSLVPMYNLKTLKSCEVDGHDLGSKFLEKERPCFGSEMSADVACVLERQNTSQHAWLRLSVVACHALGAPRQSKQG